MQYKYKLTGSLKERILDEKFFIKLLQGMSMEINGVVVPLTLEDDEGEERPDIKVIQKHIEWLEKLNKTLEIVHAREDLNCETLSAKEEKNIRLIVEGVLEKKRVCLNVDNSTFGTISFGNLKLMICALHRNDDGKFDLFSYYDAPVLFKGVMKDNTEFDSTYFIMLTKDQMISVSNIDLHEIIKNIKKVKISAGYINQVTLFLLELIKVYDETNNDEYYDKALELCDWLRKKDYNRDNVVHILNYYQLKKRKGDLSDRELANLREICRNDNDLTVKLGANILLGKVEAVRKLYARLDDDTKQSFLDYPICKLCDNILG